ncbi:MAG: replication-relaxation family protein [Gammaproteobacteria bacterium]
MSGRAARLRAQLGERDLAVLDSLAKLRLLTGKQIQRLHIADGSPLTRARRTRSTLQRLTALRLVTRLERRIGGIHAGSEGAVYGLTGLGQAVLAIDGSDGRRHRTVWATKPAFQDHVLAIGELCVRLSELSRDNTLELMAFDTEPACWRRFPGSGGQPITLKPDAYVRLGIGDFEHRAFIELDLSTESLPTVQRKCQRHVAYWQSGLEQQRYGVFPKVWWLVPSPHRRDGIASVIGKLAHSAQALFTVALHHEAPYLLTQPPQAAETEA